MTSSGAEPARVTVRVAVDGGFAPVPGLAGPFEADSDQLDADAGQALRTLLSQADFFAKPAALGASAPGAADVRTYTITATEGARSHTVRAVEPIADPAVARLVAQVIAHR